MATYDTSELIATIKTKALVPTNQSTFTNAQILKIADEELQMGIVPLIKEAREEYFVTYEDYTLVTGQKEYQIPSRAVGSTLSDIIIIDTQGNSMYSVPLLEASQVPDRNDPFGFNTGIIAYLQANNVVLNPAPDSFVGGYLRLKYVERRNNLVETSAAGRIDAINTSLNQVTLGNVPSTFNTQQIYDFVKAKPGFDNLDTDVAVTGISGSVFTFSSLPSNLSVGDYLCLAGESPVPQIPVEFHMVLAQRVIVRMLEALGDTNGVQIARSQLESLQRSALKLITPRVMGEAKKIVNTNGPLNGGGRWRRWWQR